MVHLRLARAEDSELVRVWRNDTRTRTASRRRNRVTLEEHQEWFSRMLREDAHRLLMVESEGTPIGVIRFDRGPGSVWEMSINLAPDQRGKGLGPASLVKGVEWAGSEGLTHLQASVRVENLASLISFQRAGFEEISRADGMILLTNQVV